VTNRVSGTADCMESIKKLEIKPNLCAPNHITLAHLAIYLILHIYVVGVHDKKEASSVTKMETHVFDARPSSAALLTLLVSIDRLATFAFQT
jgi:hypothetical protein